MTTDKMTEAPAAGGWVRIKPTRKADSIAGGWVRIKPTRKAEAAPLKTRPRKADPGLSAPEAEAPAAGGWVKLKPTRPGKKGRSDLWQLIAAEPEDRTKPAEPEDLQGLGLIPAEAADPGSGLVEWADRFLPSASPRLTIISPDNPAKPLDPPGTTYNFTSGLLQWYGSKFALAEWVIGYFPYHKVYVEAFSGPANVFLSKPVAELEIINDTDGRLTNFLVQVRDRPESLAELIALTPYSEALWKQAALADPDPLTDAANFWLYCAGSIRGGPVSPDNGFRWNKKPEHRYRTYADPAFRSGYAKTLKTAARRLSGALILNRDAFRLIPNFLEDPDCLIYADPPYMLDTRVNLTAYGDGEIAGDKSTDIEGHSALAGLLKNHKGYAVISGYQNEVYDYLYSEWTRYDRMTQTNSGGSAVESVWVNPKTAAALNDKGVQLALF